MSSRGDDQGTEKGDDTPPEDGQGADERADSPPDGDQEPADLTALPHVGEVTASVLAAADVEPKDITERRLAYRDLLDVGVDPSVAEALRTEFSLQWSRTTDDGDLSERSDAIRTLGEHERAWIAASTGDWENVDVDVETPTVRVPQESPLWETHDRPVPVTAVTGVGPGDADRLAEAGVLSVAQLAAVDAGAVARALDIDVRQVRTWRHVARELGE